ncbi:Bifunctional nuclease 2-like protein [Drosera capensis]
MVFRLPMILDEDFVVYKLGCCNLELYGRDERLNISRYGVLLVRNLLIWYGVLYHILGSYVRKRAGKMVTLQGNIIFPTVCAKAVGVHRMMLAGSLLKSESWRSGCQGSKVIYGPRIGIDTLTQECQTRRLVTVSCAYSSSNGNGSRAENFNESDEDYVNSSVLEAVEMKSGFDGYTVKMRDGRCLKCVHNNPHAGNLPGFPPLPVMVLKMEDGNGLFLPIIVSEMANVVLMPALHNVHIARPTMYEVEKEMIEKMGYEGDSKTDSFSLDLRPSDAINIAVRCKVPIQVKKTLINSDGIRIVEAVKLPLNGAASDGLSNEWDMPSDLTSVETTEFRLLRNMIHAAGEERYQDAGSCRLVHRSISTPGSRQSYIYALVCDRYA